MEAPAIFAVISTGVFEAGIAQASNILSMAKLLEEVDGLYIEAIDGWSCRSMID